MAGPKSIIHIPAFTFVELVVSIILSALVLAAAYLLFTHITLTTIAGKTKDNRLLQISTLHRQLMKDFMLADSASVVHDSLICHMKKAKACYYFQPDHIIRNQEALKDTFFIEVKRHAFFYLGVPVTTGSIEELALEFISSDQDFQFVLQRRLDAVTLMSHERKE